MRRCAAVFLLLAAVSGSLSGGSVASLEFIGKPAGEILLVLAALADEPLQPDGTLGEPVSFYFPGGEASEALEQFLRINHLYRLEGEEQGKISRVRTAETSPGRWDVDARGVFPGPLLRSLSDQLKVSILHDPLPEEPLTLHLRNAALQEILETLLGTWEGWEISSMGTSFFLNNRRILPQQGGEYFDGRVFPEEGLLSAEIRRGSVAELLRRLFLQAGEEYILLGEGRGLVENFFMSRRSLAEMLELLCSSRGAEWYLTGGVYYIHEKEAAGSLRPLRQMKFLPLLRRQAADLAERIPPDILPSGGLVIDPERNGYLVLGTPLELETLESFLSLLDAPREDWEREFLYLPSFTGEEPASVLPDSLASVRLTTFPGEPGRVLAEFPAALRREVLEFFRSADRPRTGHPVRLKYLESRELLESLPPGFTEGEVVSTPDPGLIFLLGDSGRIEAFQRQLSLLDRPAPQIRYDLLVLQYQENRQLNCEFSFSNGVLGPGDRNAFLGYLGEVLSLNFDITSALGYEFAVRLNAEMGESRARVLADTTLNGLSGQRVRFQNTSTFRYRDTVKDPETGSQEVTGISREITSGLFLDIQGRISGEKMITMTVSATLSKQEEGSEGDSGTLPPTSEKIVQTSLRTLSGVPVVLGGLKRQDRTLSLRKIPLLGDLPLVGFLFQKRREILENSELVIYILPVLEVREDPDSEEVLERYHEKYRSWFQ